MSSPQGYGLPLFPLQRAVCRAIEGVPLGDLARHPDVLSGFGGEAAVDALRDIGTPFEVILLAAVRSFKSQVAAGTAIRASQTVDVSKLHPGEVPRVVVISLTLDNASATFDQHIKGMLENSKVLSSLLVEKPTTDTAKVWHPTGRVIEIKVVPLTSAGSSLVSRWLLGAIFDEAPRCPADGAKSLTDARKNAVGRMLEGGQILTVGSKWSSTGPVPELERLHWGKPSKRMVVIQGTGPQLNAAWWTPERCAKLKEEDPDTYRTDVENKYLDPESALIPGRDIDACTRPGGDLPRETRYHYLAVMDPATRGNAWAVVILTVDELGKRTVVARKQWVGSRAHPLSPKATLREQAAFMRPYGLTEAVTDQWSADALRELAEQEGLTLVERNWDSARKYELCDAMRVAFSNGKLEVPTDLVMRTDILNIRKRVTQTGIAIDMPKTADGRHCDYAAVLALSFGEQIDPPEAIPEDDDPGPSVRRDPIDALSEQFGYGAFT